MSESILTSVKKNLGIDESYTHFDADIILYINGAFSTLNQIGIGPEDGFAIVDKTTLWSAFIGSSPKFSSVRTYVYLQVRLLFDPPQTQYLVEALNHQMEELIWRLNTLREETQWTPPEPVLVPDDSVLDGGPP